MKARKNTGKKEGMKVERKIDWKDGKPKCWKTRRKEELCEWKEGKLEDYREKKTGKLEGTKGRIVNWKGARKKNWKAGRETG